MHSNPELSPGTEGRPCLHDAEHPLYNNHLGHNHAFHVIIIHPGSLFGAKTPLVSTRKTTLNVFTGALQNELILANIQQSLS